MTLNIMYFHKVTFTLIMTLEHGPLVSSIFFITTGKN